MIDNPLTTAAGVLPEKPVLLNHLGSSIIAARHQLFMQDGTLAATENMAARTKDKQVMINR